VGYAPIRGSARRGSLLELPEARERMQKIAFLRARLTDEHQPRLT
jgi:hypothetical protein